VAWNPLRMVRRQCNFFSFTKRTRHKPFLEVPWENPAVSGHSRGGVYHNQDSLIAPATPSPHVTFNVRGRFANMAPLSNRPRCKHPRRSSVFLTVPHVPSPSSKSPLSAFLATSSRGVASLTNQRRRSFHLSFILSSSPAYLIYSN
jgi:hypothetical protein